MFPISTSTLHSVKRELETALSPDPQILDRQTLLDTLLEVTDAFGEGLGHTSVLQNTYDTADSAPIRQHPWHLPYAYWAETKSQIQDMLKQGAIQPSDSPWASPIVLVEKKDDSFRFCVNYRKLNSVTQNEVHPVPGVDDFLVALQGSCLFSMLGVCSGYWQISVDPPYREKTVSTTPDGLSDFCRLPFGVTGGCATFPMAIEIVPSSLSYDTCLCYFDDIIIPSLVCNNIESI